MEVEQGSSSDDEELFRKALTLVAARRIDARQGAPIHNQRAYMAKTVAALAVEYADFTWDGELTAETLADQLEPPPVVRAAVAPRPDCDFCDNIRFLEATRGVFEPCPKCQEAESA